MGWGSEVRITITETPGVKQVGKYECSPKQKRKAILAQKWQHILEGSANGTCDAKQ
jgi:hypothetical protein